VLGFVRDMIVALAFGAGPVTDAFFVAFRIPNILRRLLAEGALSTAVIPVFTEYAVARSREDLVRMLRAVLAASLLVLGAVTVVGVVATPWIVAVIAPGFVDDPGQRGLAVQLTRVMFPYLVLVGLAAFAMGVLNSQGRFFVAALGPAILNLGMIVTVLALVHHVDPPILALAIGVLVGGVGQLLVQLPSLGAIDLLVAPSGELGHPALGRVARLLLPAVFGLAAVQVMVFANTLLASLLPAGSISFLYYADRVMEFPLGVFGIALASASLPAMARQAAEGDVRAVAGTVNFALRLASYVSIPSMVGLVILSTPITRLLFERGRFGPAETSATAAALVWYSLGLVGFAGARIAAQAFYAVAEPGTAVKLGVLAIVANVIAAVVLMGPMGHSGLAAASSFGAYVNLGGLLWAARRRFGPLGGRALLRSVVRTTVASVPLLLWCLAGLRLAERLPLHTTGRLAGWLTVTVVGGAAVFAMTSVLLRSPERVALWGMLPSRRGR
jgi:putative peptidoglycan lipid II flippase